MAPAWADYDRDGWLDLYVAVYDVTQFGGDPDLLYYNNGDGTFTNVAGIAIPVDYKCGRSLAWGDYDNDGWVDIYVGNYRLQPNFLYHNNGDGTFTDLGPSAGVAGTEHTLGVAWGDYDNDGDLDLFTATVHRNSILYRNNGDGTFTDVTEEAGVEGAGDGTGATWGDYNNDGWLDLVTAGVYMASEVFLYRNNGDGTFTDVAEESGVEYGGWSQSWTDYNNDGWLDLHCTAGPDRNNTLYLNSKAQNHWLEIKLVGTDCNRAAIGTRVRLVAGGLVQLREIHGGLGMSQDMPRAHFGLGSYTGVDTLEIRWPCGRIRREFGLPCDQLITRVEGGAAISHIPWTDTEDTQGPYPVVATIVPAPDAELDEDALLVIYGTTGAFTDTLLMTPTLNPDEYSAYVPGPLVDVDLTYYLSAAQVTGPTVTHPYRAPECYHSFHIGPDWVYPVITQVDSLGHTVNPSGSQQVKAVATDNIGIAQMLLIWAINEGEPDTTAMIPTDWPDEYAGVLFWAGQVGDRISSYVAAIDASSNRNTTLSDTYEFEIVSSLLLDDFESGTGKWDLGTGWGISGLGHEFSKSITDSPQGDYANNADNPLTFLQTFNFTACSTAVITYWHWWSLEDGHDYGYVEASAPGVGWTKLDSCTGYLFPIVRSSSLLADFCGFDSVRVRFRLTSDEEETRDGWYLDNVTVWTDVERGDVNCDGQINILDVVRAVNIILSAEPSSFERWAADCNDDGVVNILDVVGIVNVILGAGTCPPTTTAKPVGSSARVWIQADGIGRSGKLPIFVEAEAEISGAQLKLNYDATKLSPGDPQLTDRSAHMTLTSNAKDGELTVVLYSTEGKAIPSGSGPILTVSFEVADIGLRTSNFGLEFKEVILVGEGCQAVPVEIEPISLKTGSLLPQTWSLEQNYPNPFNPYTDIRFQIPSLGSRLSTLISLKICNMLAGGFFSWQHEIAIHILTS